MRTVKVTVATVGVVFALALSAVPASAATPSWQPPKCPPVGCGKCCA